MGWVVEGVQVCWGRVLLLKSLYYLRCDLPEDFVEHNRLLFAHGWFIVL